MRIMSKIDMSLNDIQQIFDNAFSRNREDRSHAYKEGVMYILKYRFDKEPPKRATYLAGSVESDAFWAGTDEGHALANAHISRTTKLGRI